MRACQAAIGDWLTMPNTSGCNMLEAYTTSRPNQHGSHRLIFVHLRNSLPPM
jgi:hypothetical protein